MKNRIFIAVILSMLAFESCGQEKVYDYIVKPASIGRLHANYEFVSKSNKPVKTEEVEYKIRDIDLPDTSYQRVYTDNYSLRLTALPLKLNSGKNERAVMYFTGGY